MAEGNVNPVAETEPGYGQLFAVLIRRRFWLLGVFCIAMSVAVVQARKAKPTYQSSMQLLVEPNYQGKKGEGNAESQFADSNVQVDSATQLNLMQGTQLIWRAVDLLRPEYPSITADEIKGSLVVSQVLKDKAITKIFQATYTDKDPVKAQKVLKAIQKVYQAYNREQQNLRLVKGLAFIDEQIPKASEGIARSEAEIEQLRKSEGLIDPEAQAQALSNSLANLEKERQTIRAQSQELQSRYDSLRQELARSPQDALIATRLSQSSRYQSLLSELQKLDLTIAQQRWRFTDENPILQKFVEQRQSLLALLRQETQRVLGEQAVQPGGNEESFLRQGQISPVDVNLSSQTLEVQTNLRALQARDQLLAQIEQQVREQLKRFPRLLAEFRRIQPEVQLKRDTLQQLMKARQELSMEIARGGFDWQVVEEPQLGTTSEPKTKQTLLMGAVVGLMLGGVAAFVRDMIDDSVHSSDELKKQVDIPLLGITPQLPQAKKSEPIIKLPFSKPQPLTPLAISVIDWAPFRESLDLIYQNIQVLSSTSTFKSLMITSALAGEGKSTLALGLATSAARLHQRVLLIDADLRRPSLHKMLNLPNGQGLSTLLASDSSVPIQNSIQLSDSHNNISVLTSGPTPKDPAQLLSSPQMKELMAMFEQSYDLILLDAPPALGVVDAILAASLCHSLVMVARIDRITRTELAQATTMLSKLNVIGIVANGASIPGYVYGQKPQQHGFLFLKNKE